MVPVAVSTKYIGLHDQSPHSQSCNKCMCIRVVGADTSSNNQINVDISPYVGAVFKGKVMDQCPECDDEHVDVLKVPAYTNVVPANIAYSVGVWAIEWQWIDCAASC